MHQPPHRASSEDGRAVRELRDRVERLERANAHLHAVAECRADDAATIERVARDLAAAIDTEDVLRRIVQGVQAAARGDGAYADTVDIGRAEVEVVAGSGWGYPPVGTRVPYPGSLTEAIIVRGAPEIIRNLHGTERPIARELRRSCHECHAIVAPLLYEGEALGALVILRRVSGRPFSRADVARIRTLSDLAALSLRRVRTMDELRVEHRRAEEAEERFRSLFAFNLDPVFLIDRQGRFTSANPAGVHLGGYPLEEALGQSFETFVYPDDRGAAREVFRHVLAGEARCSTLRVVRQDSSIRHVELTGVPMRVNDRIVGLFAVVRDVTDRTRFEEERGRLIAALDEERSRLVSLFDLAPTAMAILRGPHHVIERVNPNLHQFFGVRDSIGKPVREALPELAEQGYFDILDRVYRTGEPYVGTQERLLVQRVPDAPPEERYANFVIQPLRDAGHVSGIFVHGVDVTDLVRARKEAEKAREVAEEASRAKSDFLSVMSHELRTPLTAVLGYTDLIEMGVAGPVTDQQRAQLGRIRVSALHLLEVIEEILTYSRTETGREKVRPERVDLRDAAREAADITRPTADERALSFRLEIPDRPVEAVTDAGKVRRLLLNVLGNAVKFTEAGEVALRLDVEGDDAVFRVSDTGIGIEAGDLKRIFEPFWQAEQPATRERGGTGLGLAVARRLARMLGGDIDAESTPGVGSTFRIRLPLHAPGVAGPA